ncbi:MAG: efflux RND transporter periplasmic adaptor subunit [Sphingopyxis sp.]|nr:efflux RND transporter periplasmic adaptor subunit [Sphingopyxis sp.]
MTQKNRFNAGAAVALAAAVALGFGAARLTQSEPVVQDDTSEKVEAPSLDIAIAPDAIKASQITIARAAGGELDATISASATVETTPDAEAVLTARAAGTVVRIFKRIGDPVRAGETLALVESRDASAIVADRSAAVARVQLAQRQLDRERSLFQQGVSPRADYETALANLAVAQADAQRASAAAGATKVAADGRSVSVVSPVSGRITAAAANLGRFVAAETELFRIADPSRLQITANLPATEAFRVRAGDRVELSTADGRVVEGKVRSETGVVDPTTRAATVVVTPIGGAQIVPGQLVQARIFASGGGGTGNVMVPQDAVQTIADNSVVFIRTKDGFRAQPIRIGARSGGMVAILAGLKAGTPIATINAFLLKAELEKEAAE